MDNDFNRCFLSGTIVSPIENRKSAIYFILEVGFRFYKDGEERQGFNSFEVFYYRTPTAKLEHFLKEGAKVLVEGRLEEYVPAENLPEKKAGFKKVIRAREIYFTGVVNEREQE